VKTTARGLALDALDRIERTDAYANLLLPSLLARSPHLSERDRAFVTELVYGVTRMRRACDWLVDRFVQRPLDRRTRNVLRMGAYQLVFLGTPPHAAISTSVELGGRASRLVEAVLRRVAESEPDWPNDATRLSYPDWIVERLRAELGSETALQALETMNQAPQVHERPDGYVQDLSSQWVAAHVGAKPGETVADVCAAPGGKATALASEGAFVVAGDVRPGRARLVHDNARRLGLGTVAVVVADGRCLPLRPVLDRVLVDAPCSGLGVLRRRPDARWRMSPAAVVELASLQRQLVVASAGRLRAGGRLVYSVCTMTREETSEVDEWLRQEHPELEALPPPGPPWTPLGRGALLLPQAADTDGMFMLTLVLDG
jgi:16S rRNA (cytosine967-C5)-methyltransferase